MFRECSGPDFYGTPEFFVSKVIKCESAGGSNVRIYCVSYRGTEIVPLYTTVMSIEDLLEAIALIRQRSSEIWNDAQMALIEMH